MHLPPPLSSASVVPIVTVSRGSRLPVHVLSVDVVVMAIVGNWIPAVLNVITTVITVETVVPPDWPLSLLFFSGREFTDNVARSCF